MIRLRRRCINPARRTRKLELFGLYIAARESRFLLEDTELGDLSWPLRESGTARDWDWRQYSAPVLEPQQKGREAALKKIMEERRLREEQEWLAQHTEEEAERRTEYELRREEAALRAQEMIEREAEKRVEHQRRVAEIEWRRQAAKLLADPARRLSNVPKMMSAAEMQRAVAKHPKRKPREGRDIYERPDVDYTNPEEPGSFAVARAPHELTAYLARTCGRAPLDLRALWRWFNTRNVMLESMTPNYALVNGLADVARRLMEPMLK